jgi:hypothetical protein
VPGGGEHAQVTDGRGRNPATGDLLRDAIAEGRGIVADEHQVEPPQDRPVLGDEYVVRTLARLLLGQSGVVLLREVLEVVVTTVGDREHEVAAVGQLEVQDRRGVVGPQELQLGHRARLATAHEEAHSEYRAARAVLDPHDVVDPDHEAPRGRGLGVADARPGGMGAHRAAAPDVERR